MKCLANNRWPDTSYARRFLSCFFLQGVRAKNALINNGRLFLLICAHSFFCSAYAADISTPHPIHIDNAKNAATPHEVSTYQNTTNSTINTEIAPELALENDAATAVEFNASFLNTPPGQKSVDLSIFAYGNAMLPGVYLVDVYINRQFIEQSEIRFELPNIAAAHIDAPNTQSNQDKQSDHNVPISRTPNNAQACLTKSMLARWGVVIETLPLILDTSQTSCIALSDIIAHSSVTFDNEQQKLEISVPQILMRKNLRGRTPPELWDTGISAAIINYQLIATRNENKTQSSTQHTDNISGTLQTGANMGAWRLRSRANYRHHHSQHHWQTLETYITRPLTQWHSQLTIGDSFTPGSIFEGIALRGISIGTDTSMLPSYLQAYAPTLRGVAQTHAEVTVKQNGYVIYTTLVSPGPFVIDDLSPTSSNGDLEMIVKEANGATTTTRQVYATQPMQVREDSWQFYLAAGRYRNNKGGIEPNLVQATLAYGINSLITAYGGTRVANIYQSLLGGASTSLGHYGAASLDTTFARSQTPGGQTQQGQAVRLQYSKTRQSTATDFGFSASRYSNASFLTLAETTHLYDPHHQYGTSAQRYRFEGNISQGIGGGRFNATLGTTHHWNDERHYFSTLGYYNNIGKVTYNIYYSNRWRHSGYSAQTPQGQLTLTLSIPLDFGQASPQFMSYQTNSNLRGAISHSINTSGSLLEDQRLTYSAGVTHTNQPDNQAFASLNLQSAYANMGVSRSQGNTYAQTTASIAGGIVIHQQDITFSQPLSETIVLISVPNANGVALTDHPGIRTNRNGYAVLPYVTPYHRNRITLETESLGNDIEVKQASLDVIPTKGAVVLAYYETRKGYKILLTVRDEEEQLVPFGARVEDQNGKEAGIVGPNGQIYLTGASQTGLLNIIWGADLTARCQVRYHLPEQLAQPSALITTTARCNK
ncbi:MAG: fimbrial biogenesis outer membrane usher protein [Ottowia sp.]|nr:fimbrial biogenesis outer membrane usher protein [Ottowia sp.]